MNTYLVSYDLCGREKSEDYERIFAAVRSFGTYHKVLYSSWIVRTEETAEEVKNKISGGMDDNDKLLVMAVTAPWSAHRLSEDALEWLEKELK